MIYLANFGCCRMTLGVLVEMGFVVGDCVRRRLSLLKPPAISSKLRLSNELKGLTRGITLLSR